ncbi:sensor histidine kinase [Anaeromyxobacter oryzae]|uniref:sensor histidine kinase n=1 Tax=Anaeromyxobacter oryzae TaxID=2918170 RepID=UPI0020C116E0|nr:HAMP domain-containing sensor histidine kinase [Anaeromyxobacter oryzae]
MLLVYGGAFVATGFALGVQARAASPAEPLPISALWALTAFALVHGAGDWAQLAVYLEQRERGVFLGALAAARLALLATSFALLGASGVLLATGRARAGRRLVGASVPGAALAAWAIWGALALHRRGGPLDPPATATAEAATRYLLGVPACAAALVGLDRLRRRIRTTEWPSGRYVAAAIVAVAAYGLFTGVVVPASNVGVARIVNLASFTAVTHVPVEIFRAASIAAAGLLLSEVFVRTTAEHRRDDIEHLNDGLIPLVAHELRTPLATVDMGAALLERLGPDAHGSEHEAHILHAVRAGVRTMNKIVTDLLDASRLEARRLSISPERMDLGPTLIRLIEWAPADALGNRTIRLVAPGPLPPVVADPVRVEQVLTNLLSNAGKYSPPGSEIVLEARGGRREITLSVTNAGAGIPACDLRRVFSRHYRTRAARTGRAPGLGLGLYIAKGLVESQGGRIWVESELGEHTTFAFTLPRAPGVVA